MAMMPVHKYRASTPIDLPDRQWPGRSIDRAPAWCSVDLRDGNQALPRPMNLQRKLQFFEHLLHVGFKEIELGYPAAHASELEFVRHVIEHDLIPDDVTIQVLSVAEATAIRRTVAALRGARRAILHLYSMTGPLQRRVVLGRDRAATKAIAVEGTRIAKSLAAGLDADGTEIQLEYSLDYFTGTELDYALDVCHAVMDVWQPTTAKPVIFNLPATVELASPNTYADQIEWMHRHFRERDKITLSLHPHNDRGTAIAAAEFGLMAGAERIEGTLFGNGERTGNVDLVTLALNMASQGIDPGLDFADLDRSVGVAEACNRLPVQPRHPYAGGLVGPLDVG